MSIDVTAETVIDRAIGDVAGYATDPRNEPLWIGGIVEYSPLTGAPPSSAPPR